MVRTITSSAVQIPLMLTMVCRNLDGPRGPISGHLRQCKPRALAAKAHNSSTCPPRITPPTPCQVHVIPAIVPCTGSSVRGSVVTGLTQGDIYRLDIFEGDQYLRKKVKVKVLKKVGLDESIQNG